MLDYRGIEALYTVQELQSFEAAAKKLHITQPAVSQRIKGLENEYGEPVLIRSLPYRPTLLGEHLISHYKRLSLLEEALKQEMGNEKVRPHLAIAINRDSLETWFLELVRETSLFESITLEIIADDQELTLDYLKKGIVSACLSTSKKEIPGGKAVFVGDMEYYLVASPGFVKKHKKDLLHAPALKFDQNDTLHAKYLEKFFSMSDEGLPYHTVPSVQGFKQFALLGYGAGLIPKIDILQELKKKKLIHLFPDKVWKVPYYWHYWDIDAKFYKMFNQEMWKEIQKMLTNNRVMV